MCRVKTKNRDKNPELTFLSAFLYPIFVIIRSILLIWKLIPWNVKIFIQRASSVKYGFKKAEIFSAKRCSGSKAGRAFVDLAPPGFIPALLFLSLECTGAAPLSCSHQLLVVKIFVVIMRDCVWQVGIAQLVR